MKIKYLGTIALTAVLLSSCGGGTSGFKEADKSGPGEAVKKYVASFVNAVKDGNPDSIAAFYPGSKGVELAPLDIAEDAIKVSEPGADGKVTVKLGGDKLLIVNCGSDTPQILDSKNLFAFTADDLEFARKTGILDDKTLDVELHKRLSDKGFPEWLAPKAAAKVKGNVTPGGFSNRWVEGPYGSENCWECYVTNSNPTEISGEDYSFRYKVTCSYDIPPSVSSETDKGKSIPADGNVKFTEGGGTDEVTISLPSIVWKISDAEIARKYGQYDGTEYAAYLNQRAKP